MTAAATTTQDVVSPLVVRVLTQRGAPDVEPIQTHMPSGSLRHGEIRFTVEDEEDVDVVVVINYLKYDSALTSRRGYIWNWHNEPIVRTPFSRGFNRVFTHETSTGDPRVVPAPPVLDWWVDKSFDELVDTPIPEKQELVSAIASTKTMIPGHQQRNDFIDQLLVRFPALDVFGHGRPKSLEDKWSGLAPYRYSIAIENTSKAHYWTEKIADCFLSYTVPVYYGATNLGEYFPHDSFIWLPLEDPERALATVEQLKSDPWEDRLPALIEARNRILNDYSLFGQLSTRVLAEAEQIRSAPRVTTRVHGRRTRPGGWIRGQGISGNLSARLERRRQRLSRSPY